MRPFYSEGDGEAHKNMTLRVT